MAEPEADDPERCFELNATLLELWGDLAERMDRAGDDCDRLAVGLDNFLDDSGAALRRALDAAFKAECKLEAQQRDEITGITHRGISRPNELCREHELYHAAGMRLVHVTGGQWREEPPAPAPPEPDHRAL